MSLSWSANDEVIAAVTGDGEVVIYDIIKGKQLYRLSIDGKQVAKSDRARFRACAFMQDSPMSLLLLDSSRKDGAHLSIWTPTEVLVRYKVSTAPGTALAYHAGFVSVGCFRDDGEVIVCSVKAGRVRVVQRIKKAHAFFISSLSLHNDYVASGSGDGTCRISRIKPSYGDWRWLLVIILSVLLYVYMMAM